MGQFIKFPYGNTTSYLAVNTDGCYDVSASGDSLQLDYAIGGGMTTTLKYDSNPTDVDASSLLAMIKSAGRKPNSQPTFVTADVANFLAAADGVRVA
jgi:hypothetical protein